MTSPPDDAAAPGGATSRGGEAASDEAPSPRADAWDDTPTPGGAVAPDERSGSVRATSFGRGRARAGRVLVDLAVIIAGVLIALSADAWWEGRQDRTRELEYLLALREDLTNAAVALEETILTDSTLASLDRAALRTLRTGVRPDSAPVAGFPLNFRDVSLPSGTLSGLVGTGDLRLIESAPLRAELVALEALLGTTLATTRSIEAEMRSNMSGMLRSMETVRHDGLELGDDPAVIGGLMTHTVLLRNRIDRHRELLAAVERARAAVDDGLADRGR